MAIPCRCRRRRAMRRWAGSKTTASSLSRRRHARRCGRRRRWLEDAGWHVEPFRPEGLEEARELWWDIFGRASRLLLEPLVAGREAEVHPNLVEFLDWTRRDPPRQRAAVAGGRDSTRPAEGAALPSRWRGFPVLLCPVAPIPAFRHGEREWAVDGQDVHYLDAWRYTAWFNLLQNPAVSVPVHPLARGPANRRPGRDATVGGAARAGGGTGHRAVARRVAGAAGAVRVERLPKHRRG